MYTDPDHLWMSDAGWVEGNVVAVPSYRRSLVGAGGKYPAQN